MSHYYSVQFWISGANIDPNKITAQLCLKPNQIRIAGQARSEGSLWHESLWSYDGGSEDLTTLQEWKSLEDGLLYLLDRLLSKKDVLKEYIDRGEVIWWCGHFQSSFDGGPTLSALLLKKLAEFGVPIFIDNYFSQQDRMSVKMAG